MLSERQVACSLMMLASSATTIAIGTRAVISRSESHRRHDVPVELLQMPIYVGGRPLREGEVLAHSSPAVDSLLTGDYDIDFLPSGPHNIVLTEGGVWMARRDICHHEDLMSRDMICNAMQKANIPLPMYCFCTPDNREIEVAPATSGRTRLGHWTLGSVIPPQCDRFLTWTWCCLTDEAEEHPFTISASNSKPLFPIMFDVASPAMSKNDAVFPSPPTGVFRIAERSDILRDVIPGCAAQLADCLQVIEGELQQE